MAGSYIWEKCTFLKRKVSGSGGRKEIGGKDWEEKKEGRQGNL